MTNTERIQANNAELREAIEMAENLPDAGGGGTPTPTQEKTVDITDNGTHTVTPDEGYALSKVTANVNVPIPEGYIKPSGTKDITENGTHSVTEYDSVSVAVPVPDGYIQPSGTKNITSNGTHDAKNYASVNVNVPIPDGYIQPSGTLNITKNGTYDVTTKQGVTVNVPTSGGGGGSVETCSVTFTNEHVSADLDLTHTNGNLEIRSFTHHRGGTGSYSVAKGTLFAVLQENTAFDYTLTGSLYESIIADGILVFEVWGDGTVTIS